MSFALKILYSLFFDLSPLCSGPVGIILFPAYSFVSPHPHIIVFTSFQFFQCIRSCLVGTNCDDLWFFVMSICTILDLISTGLFFNRLPSDIQSSGTCCQFCNTGFCRLNLKQNAVTEYSCCMRGRLSIDIEQQISQIVLASWFDSGADLLPVGQTHTFGVQTVPLVAVANPNLIDGICAGICSILLFISSLKQFHQCSIFSVVAFCFYIYLILLPSTPKRLTRFACHISAQVRCVGITACPSCGFAASGDKVRCKMG